LQWYRFAQHIREDYRRFRRPDEHPAVAQHIAPHSIALYEHIVLAYVESPACVFVSMRDLILGRLHRDKVNVILRHDVDGFPERLHLFYEAESRHHVRSTFYVLPSEADYRMADHRDELIELNRLGFDVALHTTAWGRDDQKAYFQWEIDVFRDALGFSPTTFTLHGYRPWSEDVVHRRARFMTLMPELLALYPDCAGTDYGRPDNLVISDSAFQGEVSRWPAGAPSIQRIPGGGTVKLLTHPNYWFAAR